MGEPVPDFAGQPQVVADAFAQQPEAVRRANSHDIQGRMTVAQPLDDVVGTSSSNTRSAKTGVNSFSWCMGFPILTASRPEGCREEPLAWPPRAPAGE
jgi:hypothetical protein